MKHKQDFVARVSFLLIITPLLTNFSFGQNNVKYKKFNLQNAAINTKGELNISPSGNPAAKDFNFLMGSPIVHPESIGVIELRHYILKQGMRDSFINYFEENLIQSQLALKGYPIGQYRIKGYEDNFFWIRGFENMRERSSFLPTFYLGPAWKQHKKIPNSLLANNDNVHLLSPVILQSDSLVGVESISSSSLIPKAGIIVIDFYIANTKLGLLKKLFATSFLPLLKSIAISDYTLWVSESEPNDFLQLPVFQDKNLLVMIRHFKNELDYSEATKIIDMKMTEVLKSDLQDAITTKNTLILYPTEKTINQ